MKLINLMPVKRKKIISRMLIMGALSASSLLAYAQHQQVILSGNNLTLKEAFEQIERQTNLFTSTGDIIRKQSNIKRSF